MTENYETPEEDGWCEDSNSPDHTHEHCICDGVNGGSEGEICKPYCNKDAYCKGYDFSSTNSYCRLHTTASCPIGCDNHAKLNVGYNGGLVIHPFSGWRCFIKRLG